MKTTAARSRRLWRRVFPAITTQMHREGGLDLDATTLHAQALIGSAVHGIVLLSSLGENLMLSADEKRLVMREMIAAVRGQVPVLRGVAEPRAAEACRYARDCEAMGTDGFMLMPAMIHKSPDPAETLAHFRTAARAAALPIMIYSNLIADEDDIAPEMFARLAAVESFVALKESSANTRPITDLHNTVGSRR
jgi:1-pyrroline-4-hydroxy-2-carboxylate deaminase